MFLSLCDVCISQPPIAIELDLGLLVCIGPPFYRIFSGSRGECMLIIWGVCTILCRPFLSSACLLPLSATVCGGAIHMTPLSIPSHLVHTNRDSQHDTVSIHYHNRPVYPAPLLTLRHTVFNRDVSGILYCYVHSTLWKAAAYLLHFPQNIISH